jgi:hypothetical protein
VRQYTAEPTTQPTTLLIYPGTSGSFTLYDDDGVTQAYLDPADPSTQWIRFSWDQQAQNLRIEAAGTRTAGAKRALKVQVIGGGEPKVVEFTGQPVELGR